MYIRIFEGQELIALVRESDLASIGLDNGNADFQDYNKFLVEDVDSERKIGRINMLNGVITEIIEPEIMAV